MKKTFSILLLTIFAASLQLGMAHRGQYDEEAREEERLQKQAEKEARHDKKPLREFAGGLKQATVDSTAGLIEETTESTTEDPITGTLEGARRGTGKVLDNTVKGAVKVATLGYGNVEHYEVEEPEAGSEEPTKIKFKIPGT